MLNEESTYDRVLRAYVLRNTIIPPDTLTFDARDVISANPGYTLDTVLWKISNSKTTEERRGTKINIDFNQALRYTIECVYSFKKTGSEAIEMAQDTVIVDIERKSLTPRMDIHMSSDYVPSLISVDASLSESEKSEIKKFIFDFWEGRPAAEGDSIQEYNYTTPGDKTITLTITDAAGNTESLKRTIVLKDQIKTIDFTPSLNPGITWSPVDFDATGTNGQIEDYIWNFADNTPVSHGYNVSHTYIKKGSYSITLTIVYTDGTQKSIKKSFSVVDSL